MDTLPIVVSLSGLLIPCFGILCIIYAFILYIRKRPSNNKLMLLKEEDIWLFTRNEAMVFLYWGIIGVFLEIVITGLPLNDEGSLLFCLVVAIVLEFFGYIFRVKNNNKFLN